MAQLKLILNSIFWLALLGCFRLPIVEGLECPLCYRVGEYGSEADECKKLMPCNTRDDLAASDEAFDKLSTKVRLGFGMVDVEYDDGVSHSRASGYEGRAGRMYRNPPPVCMKTIGYVRPDWHPDVHPYMYAKCVSGDNYKIIPGGCNLLLPSHDDYSTKDMFFLTIQLMCVCNNGTQNECQVKDAELDELMLALMTKNMGPNFVAKQDAWRQEQDMKNRHADF